MRTLILALSFFIASYASAMTLVVDSSTSWSWTLRVTVVHKPTSTKAEVSITKIPSKKLCELAGTRSVEQVERDDPTLSVTYVCIYMPELQSI